jgi:hypothetical protein
MGQLLVVVLKPRDLNDGMNLKLSSTLRGPTGSAPHSIHVINQPLIRWREGRRKEKKPDRGQNPPSSSPLACSIPATSSPPLTWRTAAPP